FISTTRSNGEEAESASMTARKYGVRAVRQRPGSAEVVGSTRCRSAHSDTVIGGSGRMPRRQASSASTSIVELPERRVGQMFEMLAHQPVERGEGGLRVRAGLGGDERRGALHPGHVGVALGPRPGEDGGFRRAGVDQLAAFLVVGEA